MTLVIVREIIGYGTIFRGADLMLGERASILSITVLHNYDGFLFAILPPGAFMGLAVIVAYQIKLIELKAHKVKR